MVKILEKKKKKKTKFCKMNVPLVCTHLKQRHVVLEKISHGD